MKANQMCFVSLPVSQSSRIASSAAAAAASAPRSPVWLCWRRRRRRWRQAGSGFHLHIYITYMQTAHSTQHTTHTHTAVTIVYVSVRISDCAKPDPICIRLCCRFNYTPIQAKSGSGIQLRPLLPVEMCALVLVYRCVSVCPSTLSCVSIPENTMTNEIKFKQKQTQMK